MAKIITISSAIGGVGKSFFSCNLACALKQKGEKVLLVDASFGSLSHEHILGYPSHTRFNILDVCLGICPSDDAITYSDSADICDFISAAPMPPVSADLHFKKITDGQNKEYDYIIFDIKSAEIPIYTDAIKASDMVLLLTDENELSAKNTAFYVSCIKNNSKSSVHLILNKIVFGTKDSIYCAEDIADECDASILGIIPFDENAAESVKKSTLAYKYNCPSGRAIQNISMRIMGDNIPAFEDGNQSGLFAKGKLIIK